VSRLPQVELPTIRTITPDEFERFLVEPLPPRDLEAARKFLRMQLDTGETRPEWCFVLESGGKFVARVLCYTFPGAHPEYGIYYFRFMPEMPLAERKSFILEVTKRMHDLYGARSFTHQQRTSSDRYDENVALFRACGFTHSSSRILYKLDLTTKSFGAVPSELTERSVTDAGEDEFLRAFQIITADTLDTEDRLRNETFGAYGGAKSFFEMMIVRDTSCDRWKLYYAPSGEIAGLSIPQFFGTSTDATIGYLGITPGYREKGYAKAILNRAHQLLAEDGALRMFDECDAQNIPAKRTIEQAGYTFEYEKEHWILTIG